LVSCLYFIFILIKKYPVLGGSNIRKSYSFRKFFFFQI
jgi:hypothetical protein